MDHSPSTLCPEVKLTEVVDQLRIDDDGGLARLATLMQSWPLDPRLHFLKGSVLAGLQRYVEGRSAMARAIEIAPDFALARFQLGFLDMTSGRTVDALGVWQMLGQLPEDEPLRLFAEGLANLITDNFSEASRLLTKGMALNQENPLINADMQLILDEISQLVANQSSHGGGPEVAAAKTADGAAEVQETPASAVDLLLRQQGIRSSPSKLRH